MVVSLLALLFVIITGFLNLARNGRETVVMTRAGDQAKRALDGTMDMALAKIGFSAGQPIVSTKPGYPQTGNDANYPYADIPGVGTSYWLGSAYPVWDAARPAGVNPSDWMVQFTNDPNPDLEAAKNYADLWRLRYPALTALEPVINSAAPDPRNRKAQPVSTSIVDLMTEDYNDKNSIFSQNKGDSAGTSTGFEVSRSAARPAMDATGSGVPDSHLLLTGSATELANSIAGVNIGLPRYDFVFPLNPASVPMQPTNGAASFGGWTETMRRMDEQARYVTSVRIISHGGMVALDSPPLPSGSVVPWNRYFVINLFNSIMSPVDKTYVTWNPTDVNRGKDLTALHNDVAGVEASLRRRGGMLPTYRQYAGGLLSNWSTLPAEPAALQKLERTFPATFLPAFDYGSGTAFSQKKENWERFNLGLEGNVNLNERAAFSYGAAMNPNVFSTITGAQNAWKLYASRQMVSSINYSDELSRKQEPNAPEYLTPGFETTGLKTPGTYPAAKKFYLGDVQKAFVLTGGAYYASDTVPINSTSDLNGLRKSRSDALIERLAGYYYDMLSSHSAAAGDEWATNYKDIGDPTATPANPQAVTRYQQAMMLTVNTAAAAAPRDDTGPMVGFIDTVVYPSPNRGSANPIRLDQYGQVYIGYAPQPVFSEVICYDADPNKVDPGATDPMATGLKLSFAVEIFNPNDVYDPQAITAPFTVQDPFALYMPQFAISIDEEHTAAGPPGLYPLAAATDPVGTKYMNGRLFRTYVITDQTADPNAASLPFTSKDPANVLHPMPMAGYFDPLKVKTSPAKFTLRLWRAQRDPSDPLNPAKFLWFPIDRIRVDIPPDVDGENAWTSVARDAHPVPYFNDPGAAQPTRRWARWSMMTDWNDSVGDGTADPISGTLNAGNWISGNKAQGYKLEDPDADVLLNDMRAPITPMPLMNAKFGDASIYGLPRPRSFPTVGFMMFIPRFSHLMGLDVSEAGEFGGIPMTAVTLKQWVNHASYSAKPTGYPADFAHMPLFDNTQRISIAAIGATKPASTLQTTGPLPWGQLIFDYFTVLNPNLDLNNDRTPDIDPMRVPGRVNVNMAPWQLLSALPMLADLNGSPSVRLPGAVTAADMSPAFWDYNQGVLSGEFIDPLNPTVPHYRLLVRQSIMAYGAQKSVSLPWYDNATQTSQVGPWLAASAAAYRDGMQYYVPPPTGSLPAIGTPQVYWDSFLRNYGLANGTRSPYRPSLYGSGNTNLAADTGIRGQAFDVVAGVPPTAPRERGFVTIGELLNVKGWDSSTEVDLVNQIAGNDTTVLSGRGDFIKAVSQLALLDTAFLTTRSNTFTAYVSVMDRKNPENSLRSQVTVDRSNMLPMLVEQKDNLTGFTIGTRVIPGADKPEIISKREVGYYNAKYD